MSDQQPESNGQQPPDVTVSAGVAGAAAGAHGQAAPATGSPPGQFATEVMDGDPAYGLRFTSDHPEGGDYPPVPPPPAEEQHAAGHHPLAAEHERMAVEACGSRQAMQGTEQPNINEGTVA